MNITIGLVTFKNKQTELKKWAQSLHFAMKRALDAGLTITAEVVNIDNSGNTPNINLGKAIKLVNIPNKRNLGYTAGNNKLIKYFLNQNRNEYYLAANPDGVFHPDFFKSIIPFAESRKPHVVEALQFPEEHLKYYDPHSFETDWASGCCLLTHREVFEKVGLLDEEFFMYVEDVDFSWRCREAGYKIFVCPNAKYGHFVLNRPHNPNTQKYMLNSGRYLAFKWGNQQFQKFCEDELLKNGFFKTRKDLPSFSRAKKIKYKTITPNFNNRFYFAEPRW